jgi:hypothetical protein
MIIAKALHHRDTEAQRKALDFSANYAIVENWHFEVEK